MSDKTVLTCAQCNTSFERITWTIRPGPQYCSNRCKISYFRAKRPDYRKIPADLLEKRAISRKIVAQEKRLYAAWARRAKIAAGESVGKTCRDCRAPVPKNAQRCEPCRMRARAEAKKRELKSPSRRAAKALREAHKRGAVPGSEKFDPIEVLERCNWRCHLCGVKTPKRLRGTYDDRAPEVDHIVPLAAGGAHTRQNTACACRKCNQAKGARPLGQLQLLAA